MIKDAEEAGKITAGKVRHHRRGSCTALMHMCRVCTIIAQGTFVWVTALSAALHVRCMTLHCTRASTGRG